MIHSDQLKYKNTISHIFMNFTFVEIVEGDYKTKVFRGYDNYTLKNVLIKIFKNHCDEKIARIEPENLKIEKLIEYNFDFLERKQNENMNCFGFKGDKITEEPIGDHILLYQIIKILNNPILPTVILEETILDYKIVIQEIPEGEQLESFQRLSIAEFFKIFNQLLSLFSILNIAKIKIPKISYQDLVVTNEFILKLKELKYAYFSDDSAEYDRISDLRNIFNVLHLKIIEPETAQFRKLKRIFEKEEHTSNSISINDLCTICEVDLDLKAPSFALLDFLVVDEINKIGFKGFNFKNATNRSMKEFFIYKIVEKYVYSSSTGTPQTSYYSFNPIICEKFSHSDNNKHTPDMLWIEFSLRNHESTKNIIRKRSAILKHHIQIKNSLCSIFRCNSEDGDVYIEIPIVNREKFYEILKILRFLKIESWLKGEKIVIDDLSLGLNVIIYSSRPDILCFNKKEGRTEDFLNLISELVETMKLIE